MSYCHIEDAKTVLEIGIIGVEMIKASFLESYGCHGNSLDYVGCLCCQNLDLALDW